MFEKVDTVPEDIGFAPKAGHEYKAYEVSFDDGNQIVGLVFDMTENDLVPPFWHQPQLPGKHRPSGLHVDLMINILKIRNGQNNLRDAMFAYHAEGDVLILGVVDREDIDRHDFSIFDQLINDPHISRELLEVERESGKLDRKMIIWEINLPEDINLDVTAIESDSAGDIFALQIKYDDLPGTLGLALQFQNGLAELVANPWTDGMESMPSYDQFGVFLTVINDQWEDDDFIFPMYVLYNENEIFTVGSSFKY